jgi:clan AA aspartic protease
MGTVYAEITVKNAGDEVRAWDGHIKEADIRQITATAMVDTGAGTLVIDEEICQKLGLRIEGLRGATLADGVRQVCKLTEPVRIQWKNRATTCHALVLPDAPEGLLGAIPLEDMDLIVHPKQQELVGAHGDEVLSLIL